MNPRQPETQINLDVTTTIFVIISIIAIISNN
jgi:hypothetical protein